MLGLGSYPSYTWRSLWITRGLLEKGLGWRVGTGTSISIWNDCWLPGPGGCKVQHTTVTTSRLLLFFEYSVSTADLEFTHVIVEANSLAVVKKANSLHDDRSEIAGNRVAHHLAAMGVGQSLDQFWVEEVPLLVEPTVAAVRWWVNLPD
ncbi:hypothetical protein ES288_D02G238300v1 [Gossypium darwinii]|uniref:RNase H type-1 domain-containing protein n=1 Tax=Gossypium darwinii TaxID=34276 RepID=A0A5D2DJ27_GOSDA|nr:hypothetical protein ES288_D02G238300v1 [Gossypium darwinii]